MVHSDDDIFNIGNNLLSMRAIEPKNIGIKKKIDKFLLIKAKDI